MYLVLCQLCHFLILPNLCSSDFNLTTLFSRPKLNCSNLFNLFDKYYNFLPLSSLLSCHWLQFHRLNLNQFFIFRKNEIGSKNNVFVRTGLWNWFRVWCTWNSSRWNVGLVRGRLLFDILWKWFNESRQRQGRVQLQRLHDWNRAAVSDSLRISSLHSATSLWKC